MTCNKLQLSIHSHPTVHLMQLLKEISGLVLHWTEVHTWPPTLIRACIWSLTIPILKNEFFCHEIKSRKRSLVVHDVVLNIDSLDFVSCVDLSRLQNQSQSAIGPIYSSVEWDKPPPNHLNTTAQPGQTWRCQNSSNTESHCQEYLLPFGISCHFLKTWCSLVRSPSSGSRQSKRQAYHWRSSNKEEGSLRIGKDAVVFLYAVDPAKHNSLLNTDLMAFVHLPISVLAGCSIDINEISRAGLV